MYSIDVIIEKKKKWSFKELLSQRNLNYIEWFVEFKTENSIISFEVKEQEHLQEIYEFLKSESPRSRIILPNGSNIKPAKESFDHLCSKLLKKVIKER